MKRIWIVAGEASGDTHGAELMRAVRERAPDVEFVGAGGPRMRRHAGEPFDEWIAEAGVLGLWDVLKKYGYFRAKFDAMEAAIRKDPPDAVVFVDYPGFNLRMAAALRAALPSMKLIFYISPQVWAWKRNRIPRMAKILDRMLCIFPFERDLYEASGLRTDFVGHPMIERLAEEKRGDIREANLVGLFPGSREREVRKIFPVLLDAASHVLRERPDVRIAAAAASESLASSMRSMAAAAGIPCEIESGNAHLLMQRATAGLVCSGTATLEAAFFGLPYALVYRVAWLTYAVGRVVITIPYLGIVNILAGREVVHEFLQADAQPAAMGAELLRLLNDPEARAALQRQLAAVIEGLHGENASAQAAVAVLEVLE